MRCIWLIFHPTDKVVSFHLEWHALKLQIDCLKVNSIRWFFISSLIKNFARFLITILLISKSVPSYFSPCSTRKKYPSRQTKIPTPSIFLHLNEKSVRWWREDLYLEIPLAPSCVYLLHLAAQNLGSPIFFTNTKTTAPLLWLSITLRCKIHCTHSSLFILRVIVLALFRIVISFSII